MFKKKLILAALIASMTVSAVSCGKEDDSKSSKKSETTTTAETTTESETTTAEETTAEKTTAESKSGTPLTNKEVLREINDAFGLMSDGTFEGDLESASAWDIVKETDLEADEEATPELLISACIRGAELVEPDAEINEIIEVALAEGLIDDKDLSKVDMSKAAEYIERAAYIRNHQEFENETNVSLADGVVDLTGVITADDWSIEGDEIKLSADAVKDIDLGTVFILPEKSTGEGGAYKAVSIITFNNEATIGFTEVSLAEFSEIMD